MESPQKTKTGLNLPAGMNQTSLRLETFSSSFRGISSLSSPSKSTCSDRFIPCRSSSRLHAFDLQDKESTTPVKEGANEAYSRLLKSELFGSDFASSLSPAGAQGSPMSPCTNMLRFKTDRSNSSPSSPFSPSILGNDNGLSSDSSPTPKPPRKVPKTPHKVLPLLHIEIC